MDDIAHVEEDADLLPSSARIFKPETHIAENMQLGAHGNRSRHLISTKSLEDLRTKRRLKGLFGRLIWIKSRLVVVQIIRIYFGTRTVSVLFSVSEFLSNPQDKLTRSIITCIIVYYA